MKRHKKIDKRPLGVKQLVMIVSKYYPDSE